jgi:hypothetical protein
MTDRTDRIRFPGTLSLRCPDALLHALGVAADQRLTSPSEYARQALLAQLRRDGIDPAQQQPDRSVR